ncbi:MAG: CarD family transcriptional regulator [Alphaproteobacteria bacterium]|nr:CarD family transcriptional regulator [Alphaproteobacteria bacterium]
MKHKLKEGDYVVYPAHGVGKLVGTEQHNISGMEIELLVINFEKDRMVLRLPSDKAFASGLRPVSSKQIMETALETLKTKIRARRTMWSRRAQEYETKINSGDPVSLAEVLRELYRAQGDADQSYSERQIYQAALERFTREMCVVEQIDEEAATKQIETLMESVA